MIYFEGMKLTLAIILILITVSACDVEIAKKSLEKLNQEYPNNTEIEYLEQLLHNFDKELFLNELYK